MEQMDLTFADQKFQEKPRFRPEHLQTCQKITPLQKDPKQQELWIL